VEKGSSQETWMKRYDFFRPEATRATVRGKTWLYAASLEQEESQGVDNLGVTDVHTLMNTSEDIP
jgi:hypothetical protein